MAVKLREIVHKETDLDSLNILLEKEFDIDKLDVRLVNIIGEGHRKPFWEVEKSSDETGYFRAVYDYSPETRIFMSYCFHKLKARKVSKETLNLFLELKKLWELSYIRAPNVQDKIGPKDSTSSYIDLIREKTRVLVERPDSQIVVDLLKSAEKHFYNMDFACWEDNHPEDGEVNFLRAYHCYVHAITPLVELFKTFHKRLK